MSLDEGVTRWLVHLAATYPNGSVGWVVHYWTASEPIQAILVGPNADPILEEMLATTKALYHRHIGPAYADDDFVFTIWPFETPAEMFFAAGERLLATDGVVGSFRAPNT
jgi:hypothetical protein